MPAERHLVVTGCSTGLGRAIAAEALGRGWSVMGTVRKEADANLLRTHGITPALCDVTDRDDVAALTSMVEAWSDGALDALVNNAGTSYAAPVEEIDLNDVRAQFEVNVVGQISVTQMLLPLLRMGGGTVVMMSSSSAVRSPPLLGAYSASKRALEAFAEALDLETAGQGIRTLVVRPGPFETNIWDTSLDRAKKYRTGTSLYADLADKVERQALSPGRLRDPSRLAVHTLDVIESRRSAFLTTKPRTVESVASGLLPWSLYKSIVRRVLR